MTALVDAINSRLSMALSVLALVGAGLAFMDARHASASEVRDLTNLLRQSEIARIEYQISEAERRWRRITRVPEADRTQFEVDEKIDLEARKQFLLRELKRLEDDG